MAQRDSNLKKQRVHLIHIISGAHLGEQAGNANFRSQPLKPQR